MRVAIMMTTRKESATTLTCGGRRGAPLEVGLISSNLQLPRAFPSPFLPPLALDKEVQKLGAKAEKI